MKTAISLPDPLFNLAEKTASKMGISRSNLFALAIKEFIQNHNPQNVTNKLNEVYGEQESSLDKTIEKMQIDSIEKDQW